jgi:hypothetical protein
MQKAPFTQRDVPLGALPIADVNDALDTLVRAEIIEHAFTPFT